MRRCGDCRAFHEPGERLLLREPLSDLTPRFWVAIELGKAIALTADCSDDRQVNALVDETVRRFGKIDVLVNSAGFGTRGLF